MRGHSIFFIDTSGFYPLPSQEQTAEDFAPHAPAAPMCRCQQ